jgi:hypothetical protein
VVVGLWGGSSAIVDRAVLVIYLLGPTSPGFLSNIFSQEKVNRKSRGRIVEELWKSCGRVVEELWKSCGKATERLWKGSRRAAEDGPLYSRREFPVLAPPSKKKQPPLVAS